MKQTLKNKLGFDSALSVSIHDITDARNLFAFDYLINNNNNNNKNNKSETENSKQTKMNDWLATDIRQIREWFLFNFTHY